MSSRQRNSTWKSTFSRQLCKTGNPFINGEVSQQGLLHEDGAETFRGENEIWQYGTLFFTDEEKFRLKGSYLFIQIPFIQAYKCFFWFCSEEHVVVIRWFSNKKKNKPWSMWHCSNAAHFLRSFCEVLILAIGHRHAISEVSVSVNKGFLGRKEGRVIACSSCAVPYLKSKQ